MAFEKTFYPGIVTQIEDATWALVKYMHPCGRDYKWPSPEDTMKTSIHAVMCKVEMSPKSNGRLWSLLNKHHVKELYEKR